MENSAGFVLTDPDFNLQNILVGDDGTIQGLVDWDGVTVLPHCLGNDEYLFWLTRDWDPHHWDYDNDNECAVDPEKAIMTPAELTHWRAVYARAIQTAIRDISMPCPSASKISPLAKCFYNAANKPLKLQYNMVMRFEKVVNLTTGDQVEEESNETDCKAILEPSWCRGKLDDVLSHDGDYLFDLDKDVGADKSHLTDTESAIDQPVALVQLTGDFQVYSPSHGTYPRF
ncbi:MAG: hypothetical protein Q9184_008117 [Pyrenodesmia sp. 2 TL-2023]